MRSMAPSLQILSKRITASNVSWVLRSEFFSSILKGEQRQYMFIMGEEKTVVIVKKALW